MKTQKLGRGLDALLGEMDEAYENEGSQKDVIVDIALKEIAPNPFQPRKNFNEEALLELSNSIKEDGLLQPIVVKEDIDGYTIVAGERRFRATKLLKRKTIRAIIIHSDDAKLQQLAIIENIQREELNAIELALAYQSLVELHQITHNELSAIIHKSRTHITNTLRLLQLTNKTQKALVDKKISSGHARALVGLDDKTQALMVNSIIGQKLNVREIESMIKKMKNENSFVKTQEKEEETFYDLSEIVEKFSSLGYETKVQKNKISIEFTKETQVEFFLDFLKNNS